MKKIEFENGSNIEIISSNEFKRKIRGRKLTDRESKYMYELEILKSEKRCDKCLKKLDKCLKKLSRMKE